MSNAPIEVPGFIWLTSNDPKSTTVSYYRYADVRSWFGGCVDINNGTFSNLFMCQETANEIAALNRIADGLFKIAETLEPKGE